MDHQTQLRLHLDHPVQMRKMIHLKAIFAMAATSYDIRSFIWFSPKVPNKILQVKTVPIDPFTGR